MPLDRFSFIGYHLQSNISFMAIRYNLPLYKKIFSMSFEFKHKHIYCSRVTLLGKPRGIKSHLFKFGSWNYCDLCFSVIIRFTKFYFSWHLDLRKNLTCVDPVSLHIYFDIWLWFLDTHACWPRPRITTNVTWSNNHSICEVVVFGQADVGFQTTPWTASLPFQHGRPFKSFSSRYLIVFPVGTLSIMDTHL